jgi:hypothetical protein
LATTTCACRWANLHSMKTGNAHLIGRAARARSIGSKGVALVVLATAQLVIALDYSIFNVAL